MELDFSKKISESTNLQKIFEEHKTHKQINELPDTAFAYIEPGGSKVAGKTVPHRLRHFPVYDESSIQRSLAEVGKSSLSVEGKAEVYAIIQTKASAFGVEVDEGMALAAERYDGKKRSELEESAFLDPKRRSFPVVSCKNVRAAVSTWGMYKGPMSFDEFKRKLTARAKKLGCESSLPKTWKDESSAKDWEKTDEKELKRDDKKEKKEHHKDAVKDDESKLKKLKKDKPSEKKSVETHDLKKDIKYDKKKESEAASDKQKAAKEKFLEMIRKKKGGDDKDDDKDGDKKSDDKKSDDKKDDKKDSKKKEESKGQGIAPLNNIDFEEQLRVKHPERLVKTVGDDEEKDKKELKQDDKKEKKEHEKDAIKDDKKQVKDLKKDEKEDKKNLEKLD